MKDNRAITALYLSGLIVAITICRPAYSCMTTFFNNGQSTIAIIDHNNAENKNNPTAPSNIILIHKNHSRRFGKVDEHANFTVYTKKPKSQTLVATYHAQQNECGKTGNPFLNLSDLKNKTGETNFFTIKNIQNPDTSMVHQLPRMQRADIFKQEVTNSSDHCSACNAHAS